MLRSASCSSCRPLTIVLYQPVGILPLMLQSQVLPLTPVWWQKLVASEAANVEECFLWQLQASDNCALSAC